MKQLLLITSTAIILGACTSMDEIPSETNALQGKGISHVVSLENALKAGDLMYDKVYGKTRSNRKISNVEYILGSTRSHEGNEGFYVVNYGNEEGFCILSRDTRLAAVYAISDQGSLHLSDTTENKGLNWYINQGLRNLGNLESIEPVTPDVPVDSIWDQGRTKVICDALLKGVLTNFYEGSPYNAYCFTPSGEEALVGCTPLAIGTIMGYYKWPHSYGGYIFDWNTMLANPNYNRWARLFKEIGNPENCNSEYNGIDVGTITEVGKVVRAFDNMGYTYTQYCPFSSDIVNNELGQRRPVYVDGLNNSGTLQHSWVIDGAFIREITKDYSSYEGDDMIERTYYYHCVWGWGGTSNGYYLLDGETLGGTPDEYSIGNIYPSPYTFNNMYICYGMRK